MEKDEIVQDLVERFDGEEVSCPRRPVKCGWRRYRVCSCMKCMGVVGKPKVVIEIPF